MTPEISRVLNAPWTLRRGLAGLSRDQQNDVDMQSAWAWWTTYSELAQWIRRNTSGGGIDQKIWLAHEKAALRTECPEQVWKMAYSGPRDWKWREMFAEEASGRRLDWVE